MRPNLLLLFLLLATASLVKSALYKAVHKEPSGPHSVSSPKLLGYAYLAGSGSVDFQISRGTEQKSISCQALGLPVVCMLWNYAAADNPSPTSITFSVTPSSVGDVRHLSVDIVGGDFVELRANQAVKFLTNGVQSIPVSSNLGVIQKFGTPNLQRVVFEVEKIKKINILDQFGLKISAQGDGNRRQRIVDIRTTLGFRSTQVSKGKCHSGICKPLYFFEPTNILSFVFALIVIPVAQKPITYCDQENPSSIDQLHEDGCGVHAVSALKTGGTIRSFRLQEPEERRLHWFHFDESIWDESTKAMPYIANVLPKENGHTAFMRDAQGQSYTGVSIVKSSIFGRAGRVESISRMMQVLAKLAKHEPLPHICPFRKFTEGKDTVRFDKQIYLLFDYCGPYLLDDVIGDEKFQRVANAKRLILQYIKALETLASFDVYFELLRPENLRFTEGVAQIHVLDLPYVLDSKEEKIGLGYENESSTPETLMGLVYSPEKATVWSVGMLLYRLLYKMYPFTSKLSSARIGRG